MAALEVEALPPPEVAAVTDWNASAPWTMLVTPAEADRLPPALGSGPVSATATGPITGWCMSVRKTAVAWPLKVVAACADAAAAPRKMAPASRPAHAKTLISPGGI